MSKSACRLPQVPFYKRFLKNKQGLGASLQEIFYVEYFDNSFFCCCCITNFPNFITGLCFLAKLFSNQAFDDVVKFNILKF